MNAPSDRARLLIASLLSLLCACGGVPGEEQPEARTDEAGSTPARARGGKGRRGREAPLPIGNPARAERLARDQAGLRELVRRIDGTELTETILQSLAGIRAQVEPEDEWYELSDWALRLRFVASFDRWNSSDSRSGETFTALSFRRPGHAVHFVLDYARSLAEHGIDLIVMPVPTHVHLYPDHIPGVPAQESFPGAGPGSARFLLHLAEYGVEILDLLTPFAAARYDDSKDVDRLLLHDYDVHWTSRGAELAADALANRIRELEWFEQGPAREGVDFEIVRERGPWRSDSMEHYGRDPVSVWLARVLKPASDPSAPREVAHDKDRESPILVLGDSFLQHNKDEGADLISLLYARLGQRLDSITAPGGGGIEWQTLARRVNGLEGKRLVVWVVSEKLFAHHNMEKVELFDD